MLKYSKIILDMGNIISGWMNGGIVLEETGTIATNLTLWDMICHLTKQYIFSKLEQDEFLREYLVGNNSGLNLLTMGQRAITFEPLPSRVIPNPERDYEIVPKEVSYTRVRFEEVDEDEIIYVEEESSSSESEEEVYEGMFNELSLYSAYEAMTKK